MHRYMAEAVDAGPDADGSPTRFQTCRGAYYDTTHMAFNPTNDMLAATCSSTVVVRERHRREGGGEGVDGGVCGNA